MENPVKRKIDENIYSSTNLYQLNVIEAYLSKTEYSLYDNPLWGDYLTKEGIYYDVDETFISTGDLADRWYGLISIKMSNRITQIERHVNTIFDLIGTIGGFLELFDITLAIILGYIGSKMYKHSLLNSVSEQKVTYYPYYIIEHPKSTGFSLQKSGN